MPRAGLSTEAVVDLAVELLDAGGAPAAAALTLSALAERAGVATPSLYKHVRNLAELRRLLSLRVAGELNEAVSAAVAGRARDDAVRALLHAYRGYVVAHPGRYAAMAQAPDPDERLAAAAARLLDVILVVLAGYGLHGSAAVHAARALRAAGHGFAVLQAAGGFGLPEDLDTSYRLLVDMVVDGLPRGDPPRGDPPRGDARDAAVPVPAILRTL